MAGNRSPDLLHSRQWDMLQRNLILLLVIGSFFILVSACSAPKSTADQRATSSALRSEVSSASEYMAEGLSLFERGNFDRAFSKLKVASQLFEREGKPDKQCEALIKIAQVYLSFGQFNNALQTLEDALAAAEKSGDRNLVGKVLANLGNVYMALGPGHEARRYLEKSLSIARQVGDLALSAVALNDLGNLLTLQRRYQEGIGSFSESAALANEAGNYALAAIALTNAAKALIQMDKYEDARDSLDKACNLIRGLEDSHGKAYGLISIGLTYNNLRMHLPHAGESILQLSRETLGEALNVSENIGDLLSVSYAWGYLGSLLEEEREYHEALQLTRKAIFAAQQVNAPESLYKWHWQAGRILKILGNRDAAISAYRLAIDVLQSIRQEFSSCYGKAVSSFREAAGSAYFELVDLLLQSAASISQPEQYEAYLLEAREAVEMLKILELREYFKDDCVDAAQVRTTKLDLVSQTAVVVYPILFPDRTEILVSLPSGMKRFSVQIGESAVTEEVRKFRHNLEKRTTMEYLPQAQKLYDWLVRPLQADLTSLTIDTMVFVPDGALRTIPMAALHDGKDFLISKYALAITPGLNLTDPRPIERESIKILALGLTESAQGFPPLPFVSTELQAIQSIYGGTLLLNQDFLTSSLVELLKGEQFNIVHIATHGQFDSDVQNSFLLTYDDKLTMERLGQYVGLFEFRDSPLELLCLSACNTAAGDDRAALGLAGVAIRTGARSALATLWHINDQASSELVAEFYRQLEDPLTSRAVALQRAQLKMLNDPRVEHPAFWSPFILINNWL